MSSQVKIDSPSAVSAQAMRAAIDVLQKYLPASVGTVELIEHVALELVHLGFLAEGPATTQTPPDYLLEAINGWTGKTNQRLPVSAEARVGTALVRHFVTVALLALRFIRPKGSNADIRTEALRATVTEMHRHLSAQDQDDIRHGRVIVQTPQGAV